ncbi:hypothetical protein GCM10027037_12040 [Mucilaginibacter koreensis]
MCQSVLVNDRLIFIKKILNLRIFDDFEHTLKHLIKCTKENQDNLAAQMHLPEQAKFSRECEDMIEKIKSYI